MLFEVTYSVLNVSNVEIGSCTKNKKTYKSMGMIMDGLSIEKKLSIFIKKKKKWPYKSITTTYGV